MGSALQKVFQRRGDKKGKGFWIKRSALLLCLVLSYTGLLFDFPLKMSSLWFSFSLATASAYAIFHFSEKRKTFKIEFLCSLLLIFAGSVRYYNFEWLKLAYFPFMILAASFYTLETVVPLPIVISLFGVKDFFAPKTFIQEIAFSSSLMMTAVMAAFLFHKFRKEKEKALSTLNTIKDSARDMTCPGIGFGNAFSPLNTLKDSAQDMPHETGMDSLSDDRVMSLYFASMLRTDEEIKELLITLKKAVFAASVNYFVPYHNACSLRCSTENKGDIIVAGKGIILQQCIKDKQVFYSGEVDEKKVEVGYIKNGAIVSLFAVPVMEGPTLLGVLTADSSRYQAFSEPDRNTIHMFTRHLAKILERERMYPKIKRDYNGLKILKDESSNLVSSLDINVIAENLCQAAEKIAPSHAFLFISKGKKFELIYPKLSNENKGQFDLKGTFINIAVDKKDPVYMADMSDYTNPIMPFKTIVVNSTIVLPMHYENKLLGLFVMLSEKKDFLDSFQTELLKVMCNQASTSIANAKLHAEIEKLATTDGLTGLYNHRVFQEKLTEEITRVSRYLEPASLLLIDIDFFKKVNDTYGHPVGDVVLKGVAKILSETLRKDIDTAARYGGEEFVSILPETNSSGAKNIAERLRKTVMGVSFSADGATIKVTLSIGIATSPNDASTKEDLIEKADQALYHAKKNGRNQTVLWTDIK